MSWFTRLGLLALLCASALLAEGQDLTVTPAPATRTPTRWELLPALHLLKAGDALDGYRKATTALRAVDIDRDQITASIYRIRDLSAMPLEGDDLKEAVRLLAIFKKPLDLTREASRYDRADWTAVLESLRRDGFNAAQREVEDTDDLVALLCFQGRIHLAEDQPEKAIEVASCAMAIARHLSQCPSLSGQMGASSRASTALGLVEACLEHPKCPGLYGSLTALPRPFLDLQRGIQGDRIMAHGSLPGLVAVRKNPLVNLPAKTVDDILRLHRQLQSVARPDERVIAPLSRIQFANLLQTKHALARKELLAHGYDEATLGKIPHLNLALLHSATYHELALSEQASALNLPFPQAWREIEAIHKRHSVRDSAPASADEPALPLGRFLLRMARGALLGQIRFQRRLDFLRTVEALRQHAATTGRWPETLADIKVVAVPDDPATLKPFVYRLEEGVAILETPAGIGANFGEFEISCRLTLRKTAPKSP